MTKTTPIMGKSNENTLMWLYMLTAQAAGIFVLQAILGYSAGSLELQSDLAHSAIDMVTYGFNALTEWTKAYALAAGLRFIQPHLIDEVGSFISVMVLMVMMVFAINTVVRALNNPDWVNIQEVNDSRGPAMVTFSVVTLCSNVLMLWLYKSMNLSFTDTSADHERVSLVDHDGPDHDKIECGECTPDGAVCKPSSPKFKYGSPRAGSLSRQCSLKGCDDPSCDDHGKEAQDKEWSVVQWMHKLLHPGCNLENCGDLEHMQKSDDAMVNLNLGAAMLHLVTDVLRTITVLVSGILIEWHAGVAWRIDAYGALLIAAFNILGAGTLGIKAIKALVNNSTS